MFNYMLYLIIIFVAIFKAIADTSVFNYSTSIFKNLNPNFWNHSVSWKNNKFLGIVVLDAFHISYYAIFSLLFYAILIGGVKQYNFFIYWSIYFVVFELFYSLIFKL